MADTLEQLILALAQADSAVAGSDPYASPQAAVDKIVWDPSGFGAGENAAASGIKGLLSGLFGELGNDYKQRAADEYRQVLQSGMLGGQPENKVLPKELFSKANTLGGMFNDLQAREMMKEEQAAKAKLEERAADLEGKKDLERLKAELKGGSTKKFEIPAASLDGITKTRGVIQSARDIADDLEKLDPSWSNLAASRYFSGADKTGVALKMKNLADRFARARTGAAMNKNEEETFDKLIKGDLSATPKQVANLLRILANEEAKFATSQIETFEKSGDPAALKSFFSIQDIADIEKPKTQQGGDMLSFLTEAKKSGMSKEQARAAWEARGGR